MRGKRIINDMPAMKQLKILGIILTLASAYSMSLILPCRETKAGKIEKSILTINRGKPSWI